jgi:hypothetical protein
VIDWCVRLKASTLSGKDAPPLLDALRAVCLQRDARAALHKAAKEYPEAEEAMAAYDAATLQYAEYGGAASAKAAIA